jgi:uncharacterized membrane protein YkoI
LKEINSKRSYRMKIIRWMALVAIVLLVIGAMGAAAYKVYAQGSARWDNDPALQGQGGVTLEEAIAIALAQYPGAKVLGTESENEGGISLYEVELDNRAEVEVDANAGTILPAEPENSALDESDGSGDDADDARDANEVNGQDPSDVTAPANTAITADEAKKIAEEANPGATALEVDFDSEGGKDMWEIELSNNAEVEVDANSGSILATKQND